MKKYWPLFFLIAVILFQVYVSSWNKQQQLTLANTKTQTKISQLPLQKPCPSAFFYPKTIVKDNQQEYVRLETTDEPLHVVEWYKEKLQQEQFSIVTDIVDNTNGTSSNMLVGEKNHQQLSIIIGKGAKETSTTIFIHALCD